jgi:hypothetical protein
MRLSFKLTVILATGAVSPLIPSLPKVFRQSGDKWYWKQSGASEQSRLSVGAAAKN